MAEAILEKDPGAKKIIYDVRASWAVPETIERAGGIPMVCRRRARLHQARDAQGGRGASAGRSPATTTSATFPRPTAGVVPFLLMLEQGSRRRGGSCRRSSSRFRERYFITGELNTPVGDVAEVLQAARAALRGRRARSRTSTASRSTADDWHMNVRPSNTEPLLRLNLEARTKELMERKRDEVLAEIRA